MFDIELRQPKGLTSISSAVQRAPSFDMGIAEAVSWGRVELF